jgi:hypothetical protein
MSKFNLTQFSHSYPRSAGFIAASGALALAAVIVLFAWNSFAVSVLEVDALRFKEALGLTLLVGVTGRLLAPTRRHDHRHHRTEHQ